MENDRPPNNRSRYGHLRWDIVSKRWVIDGWDVHCGDCFQLWTESSQQWREARMERAKDWYLIIRNPPPEEGETNLEPDESMWGRTHD
jgi:hypothetical protein